MRFNGLLVRENLPAVSAIEAGPLLITYVYEPLRMVLDYAWHPTRMEEEL